VGDGAPQKVACQGRAQNPNDAADDVVGDESAIVHAGGASDGGGEGADDGDKARQHNRFGAVLFVEGVGALKVGAEALVTAHQRHARPIADGVVHLVADDGSEDGQRDQPTQVQVACRRHDARRHQKGVAGQKEADEQARLNEDNGDDARQPTPPNQRLHIRQPTQPFAQRETLLP